MGYDGRRVMRKTRYDTLATEREDPRTRGLDRLSAGQIVRLMNRADRRAVAAVGRAAGAVARAVDLIAGALSAGGRLLFVGAGTSGRLGVIEAAECPPTFGTPPSLVRALIAGGRRAVFRAAEGAEDDGAEAARRVRRRSGPATSWWGSRPAGSRRSRARRSSRPAAAGRAPSS